MNPKLTLCIVVSHLKFLNVIKDPNSHCQSSYFIGLNTLVHILKQLHPYKLKSLIKLSIGIIEQKIWKLKDENMRKNQTFKFILFEQSWMLILVTSLVW